MHLFIFIFISVPSLLYHQRCDYYESFFQAISSESLHLEHRCFERERPLFICCSGRLRGNAVDGDYIDSFFCLVCARGLLPETASSIRTSARNIPPMHDHHPPVAPRSHFHASWILSTCVACHGCRY